MTKHVNTGNNQRKQQEGGVLVRHQCFKTQVQKGKNGPNKASMQCATDLYGI